MIITDIVSKLPRSKIKRVRLRTPEEIKTVAIHHSLSPVNQLASTMAKYHVGKGWPTIAYTYLVYRDGLIQKTLRLSEIGYHVGDSNRSAVGICMVGNFDNLYPSPAQLAAANELAAFLVRALPNVKYFSHVLGHHEYPGYGWKSCPGHHIDMTNIRRDINAQIGTKFVASSVDESVRVVLTENLTHMFEDIYRMTLRDRIIAWIDRLAGKMFHVPEVD